MISVDFCVVQRDSSDSKRFKEASVIQRDFCGSKRFLGFKEVPVVPRGFCYSKRLLFTESCCLTFRRTH